MASCVSFPPVAAEDSRILILGSMPGEKSLREGQYYAHSQNAFWRIMGDLFGAGLEIAYPARLSALLSRQIALWDVLQTCERDGSLDASITNEVSNDFGGFFKTHPHIKHLFFNGTKAEATFKKYVVPVLHRPLATTRLPSTSPARASLTYAQKLEQWRVVAHILEHETI